MLVRGQAEVERRVRERDLFMTQITREGRVMDDRTLRRACRACYIPSP